MAWTRWLVSLFAVWHLTAVFIAAIAPDAPIPTPPRVARGDAIADTVTPVLDRVAAALEGVPNQLLNAIGPVRGLAHSYVSLTGVSQSWKMFSNPPTSFQYLRVRYYVEGKGTSQRPWRATELVLPAHREDRVRLLQGYRDSSRDKAITVALLRHHLAIERVERRKSPIAGDLPDHLAPVARFFGRRFATERLQAGERIARAEVWYGVSEMPSPGTVTDSVDRLAEIQQYYGAPVEEHRRITPSNYRDVEEEGPVLWVLEYLE